MDIPEAEKLLFDVWHRISAKLEQAGFGGLSKPEQVFAVIWDLEAEVNNGGFSQYLFNSSGDHAALAPGALREVGAPAAAELCERFFAMLPGGAPARTRDERQEQLDSAAAARGEDRFEEDCVELERRFYALEDDLRERMVEWSRAHDLTTAGGVLQRLARWVRPR